MTKYVQFAIVSQLLIFYVSNVCSIADVDDESVVLRDVTTEIYMQKLYTFLKKQKLSRSMRSLLRDLREDKLRRNNGRLKRRKKQISAANEVNPKPLEKPKSVPYTKLIKTSTNAPNSLVSPNLPNALIEALSTIDSINPTIDSSLINSVQLKSDQGSESEFSTVSRRALQPTTFQNEESLSQTEPIISLFKKSTTDSSNYFKSYWNDINMNAQTLIKIPAPNVYATGKVITEKTSPSNPDLANTEERFSRNPQLINKISNRDGFQMYSNFGPTFDKDLFKHPSQFLTKQVDKNDLYYSPNKPHYLSQVPEFSNDNYKYSYEKNLSPDTPSLAISSNLDNDASIINDVSKITNTGENVPAPRAILSFLTNPEKDDFLSVTKKPKIKPSADNTPDQSKLNANDMDVGIHSQERDLENSNFYNELQKYNFEDNHYGNEIWGVLNLLKEKKMMARSGRSTTSKLNVQKENLINLLKTDPKLLNENSKTPKRNFIDNAECATMHSTNAPPESNSSTPPSDEIVNASKAIKEIWKIIEEVKKKSKSKEGSCNLTGSWSSLRGGMLLNVTKEKDTLNVTLNTKSPPSKKGFLIEGGWSLKGTQPIPKTNIISLTGTNLMNKQVVVFIGECRVCGDCELITGNWLLARVSHDCEDQKATQDLLSDVWMRERLSQLRQDRINNLGKGSKTTTPYCTSYKSSTTSEIETSTVEADLETECERPSNRLAQTNYKMKSCKNSDIDIHPLTSSSSVDSLNSIEEAQNFLFNANEPTNVPNCPRETNTQKAMKCSKKSNVPPNPIFTLETLNSELAKTTNNNTHIKTTASNASSTSTEACEKLEEQSREECSNSKPAHSKKYKSNCKFLETLMKTDSDEKVKEKPKCPSTRKKVVKEKKCTTACKKVVKDKPKSTTSREV